MTAASEDLPEAGTHDEREDGGATERSRRRGRWLGGVALAVVIVVSGVWIERKPIASHVVDATLRRNHVPARYHIADLGLGRQRLTDVVIGDPAHPDLVADWIDVHTSLGLHGVHVTGLSAGHVRLHGRLVDGHLSLGAIDRLLPAPSGKPFALPAIDIAVNDGRMRLETPYGLVGLKLSGHGMLNNGFSGTLAAISGRLDIGPCRIDRAVATVDIHIDDARPTVTGPLRASAMRCGDVAMSHAAATVDATLGDRLDRWQGNAKLHLGGVRRGDVAVADLGGAVEFEGSPRRTSGTIDLASGRFATAAIDGAALHLAGAYRVEGNFLGFQGSAGAEAASLTPRWIDRIAATAGTGQGTPVAPLLTKLAKAGVAAAHKFDIDADIDALQSKGLGRVGTTRLVLTAASGARMTVSSGDGIQYGWPDSGLHVDGLLAMSGGELPEAAIRLSQEAAGTPVSGTAIIRPYSAGDARLTLTPVRFSASPSGATRFTTTVTLSGPLGTGRLDGGHVAVTGLWNGAGRVLINPDCAPMGFDRLATSGLVLNRAEVQLCPQGKALVAVNGSRVSGGARIGPAHLTGALGSTPLDIATRGAELRLGDRGFALADLAVKLGAPDRTTRLDFATLDGTLTDGAVTGTFEGGGGQIANVPLVLSKAKGDWTLKGGVLDVGGGLTVADAAPAPRFNPLVSDDVALRLADGRITATGTLASPGSNVTVTKVALAHDLAQGAGHADLAVPGITFDKGFQPDVLTPLTFGVIADVQGSIAGEGHIAWSPEGVTSTGTFSTSGTNLAAAFGPVTGLSTTIHFTDLLNMVSAPDQTATVAEINPGVAVENGVVHYQTLSSTVVQVLGAEWPFSGGALTLEPTTLDFSEGKARRMTFTVRGMDAGQFIQKFDFKNVDATGTFDGTLPMVFDANGGRIEKGRLAVRQGGGTVAYVGDLSQKDLGTWGNMAFQALKSIRYDTLDITLNGPLAGEMVTQVRFDGVHQGTGTHANFLVKRLMNLPFVFNVTIRAPFRQLISSARSLYDPNSLPKDKLKDLIDEEREQSPAPSGRTPPKPTIQPPESEAVP